MEQEFFSDPSLYISSTLEDRGKPFNYLGGINISGILIPAS